jgi:hypothetical protein
MPEILKDLPIVDILNTGLAGFCFLVALFGYLLLRSEQKKEEPSAAMLVSIESFTKKTLLFTLIVAGASFAALLAEHHFDGGDKKLQAYLTSLPEAIRSDNPQEAATRIRKALAQLDDLRRIPALEGEIADLEERIDALRYQNQVLGAENTCGFRSHPATDSAANWATRSGPNWTRHSAVKWSTDSALNWATFS